MRQPRSLSPRSGRAVRGKSGIGKGKLVWGTAAAGRWWWRRLVDAGQGSALEQARSHQVSKAQGRHGRASVARGDAQQQVGDQGGEDLHADSVFGAAEKGADLEMLLDPAKQQ